jgi:hypothetical protein
MVNVVCINTRLAVDRKAVAVLSPSDKRLEAYRYLHLLANC